MPRATSALVLMAAAGVMLRLPITAVAQEASSTTAVDQSSSGADVLRRGAEGGLGGPQSVGPQLEEDAAKRATVSRRPRVDALFQPIEDGLARLKRLYGLQIGIDYQALYQHSDKTFLGEKQGSSGSVRVFGKWEGRLSIAGRKMPAHWCFLLSSATNCGPS